MLHWLSKLWRRLTVGRGRAPDPFEYNVHPPNLKFLTDVSAGRWVEQSLSPDFGCVGSLVPVGYEGYARMLHPARDASEQPVRWSEVVDWSGRVYHAVMSFEGISSSVDGRGVGPRPWDDDPKHGSMDEDQAIELSRFLARYTATPDECYFGVWDGYGQYSGGTTMLTSDGSSRRLGMPSDISRARRMRGVDHDYLLYRGRLAHITEFFTNFRSQPPNIWWPADHAWFVATDIDLDSTYVGASRECISALLAHPELEAVPAELGASVAMTADAINLTDRP